MGTITIRKTDATQIVCAGVTFPRAPPFLSLDVRADMHRYAGEVTRPCKLQLQVLDHIDVPTTE